MAHRIKIQLQLLMKVFIMSYLVLGIMERSKADDDVKGIISVAEYFPEINHNLTKVIWAHGVNSMEKLVAAAEGPNIMMIEADVLMGSYLESSEKEPIMAHPPNSSSDITFRGFLEAIILKQKRRKGIKLDFKDLESVEPVLQILQSKYNKSQLNFPVWLNADVLNGPVNSTKEPINGTEFIRLAKKYLPTATLSLGWTTRYGKDDFKNSNTSDSKLKIIKSRLGYTYENVKQMMQLIMDSSWEGSVTFPVRAGLITQENAARCLGKLMTENIHLDDVSFTVWSDVDDPVDMEALRNWIFYLFGGKVYVDVPFDLNAGQIVVSERPIARTDHLQSSNGSTGSSFSTKSTLSLLLILLKNAFV